MAQLRSDSTAGGKPIATIDDVEELIEPIDNQIKEMKIIDGGEFKKPDNG